MNKFSFSFITLAATRRGLLLVASISTLALSSCATSNSPALPLTAVPAKTGAVSSLRTYEHGGRLLVVGSARPAIGNSGNHVDVELVGIDGRVVARKVERVELGHPRGSRARHGTDSFVASFPAEASRQAASIRVTFHRGSHPNCSTAQS